MLSFQKLYEQCQSLSSDSDSTTLTLFKSFLNEGIKKTYSVLNAECFYDTYTDMTVADQASYPLPPQFSKVKSLKITIAGVDYVIKEFSGTENEWIELSGGLHYGSKNNYPYYYFVKKDTYEIYPSSSTAGYTITMRYQIAPKDLTADDYTTGTASISGTTVTGSGTTWTSAMIGRFIKINNDGVWYKITARSSATSLTIAREYSGTESGSYTIGECSLIPEAYQETPIDYALYRYYLQKENTKLASSYKTSFEQKLLRVKESSNQTTSGVICDEIIRDFNKNDNSGSITYIDTLDSLKLKEITTPLAVSGYGKLYTKTDNTLYFQDGAGTEHSQIRTPYVIVGTVEGECDYVCDGVDDDETIQLAIDAVVARGGGEVYIKAHTDYYNITQAITLPAGTDIWLHGENKFATRLKLAAGSNCNMIETGTAIATANFTKITDLYLDGNKTNQTDLGGDGLQCGIFTHPQNYVTLRDLSINRCVAQGIYSHDWISHLENIFVGSCGWQGIEIDSPQYTTLINCTVRSCGSTTVLAQGIDIVGSSTPDQPSQVMVIGCHTYRNFGPGFAARNAQNVSFVGCESLEDGTNAGVEFATTRAGFHIKDSERVSVIGCHSRLSTLAGIHIEDSDRCIIQGNQCINNGGVAEAATSAGILITNGQKNNIEGNQCYDDRTPKIQAYGIREVGTTDYTSIINNNVDNNLTGTIVLAGTNSKANNNIGYTNDNGWLTADETWTYASATTITVPAGAASKYQKGDKIKLTQTTVKYFYVVGVADTTLTITGGNDYTLVDAAISLNYYSHNDNPVGFPHWMTFTPVVSGSTGSIGTYSDSVQMARFSIIGGTAFVQATLNCVNVGSWTGNLQVQMPINPNSTADNQVQNISMASILTNGTLTVEGWFYDLNSTGRMRFVSSFNSTIYPFSSFGVNDVMVINAHYEI